MEFAGIGEDSDEQLSSHAPSGTKLTEEEKRQRRKLQNRENSSAARTREKQRIESLERQVSALTEEADSLRKVLEEVPLGFVDNSFLAAVVFCMQELKKALADPRASDEEIETLHQRQIDLIGCKGKSRLETLSRTFHSTLELMLPSELRFWLWLSKFDPSAPIWADLSTAVGLSAEQLTSLQSRLGELKQAAAPVGDTYASMQVGISQLFEHATALQSFILALRPCLTPRQCGYLKLWTFKCYRRLQMEEVLCHGSNSSDFLS